MKVATPALALLLALATVLPLLATSQARAAWSEPVQLSPPDQVAWFPGIATDIAGGVHAFWAWSDLAPPGYDTVVYCPITPSGCASRTVAARREATGGFFNTRPTAFVSPSGIMHLLWARKMIVVHSAVPIEGPFDDMAWTRAQRVGDHGTYSMLRMDQGGVLHALFSQGMFRDRSDPCWGCADIHYSRSADEGQSWSIPVNLSQTSESGSQKPQIALASNNRLYLAWEEGRDHFVGKGDQQGSIVLSSPDGGTSWDPPTWFGTEDSRPATIAIEVDAHDRPVIVWQEPWRDNVYWQISEDHGATWSAPTRVPGIVARSAARWNNLDDYHMARDAAGHVHLVLTGRYAQDVAKNEPTHVFHLEWDGTQWSAPDRLFTTDGSPEWPRIAVGNGNQLHVVWFERPAGLEWRLNIDTLENSPVWYAHGTSTAPAVASVPWPRRELPFLTAVQWFRIAQAILAVIIVATVIAMTRRRGW